MRRLRLKHFAVAAAVLGTLALLGLAGLVADRYATRRADERRLDEAFAKLDADDPEWRVGGVSKVHNAAIPDDDAANVTKLTVSALGWRPASGKSRQAAIDAKEIPDLAWDDDRLPHDDEFCSLYEVHLDSGRAYGEAFAARKFPTGGLPLRCGEPDPFATLLFDHQRIREGSILFRDYSAVEAYLGRGDEALRAADASLHLAQTSLSTDPLLISQLIRNACCFVAVASAQRTLAWSEPAAGLAELQAAFAQAATVDGMTVAARGERAIVMRVFENVLSGALPADHVERSFLGGGGATSDWDRVQRRLNAPSRVRQAQGLLAVHNGLVAAMKLQGPPRRAACQAAVDAASPESAKLTPGIMKCLEADDRCKSRLLCASVGLACERYRRQFGHFPKTLADIPAAILPAVPTDPFSGKPLLYKLHPEGAVVYTVGPNGTYQADDDTGGLTVQQAQQSEFRLWEVASRRRPPLPRFDPDTEELPDLPVVP